MTTLYRHGKLGALQLTPAVVVARDINFVIMDYLINEGYPSAAKKFALEANIQPKADVDSIQERVEIRNAIHGGDIQSAIEKINELNPQVSPKETNRLHIQHFPIPFRLL